MCWFRMRILRSFFCHRPVLLYFTREWTVQLYLAVSVLLTQGRVIPDTETKHKPHHIIFHCSIPGCKSTCKRKTDMRYHLRSIHHLNQLSLENELQLCNHEIQPKNNFINTGSLKFVSHLPCDKKAQSSLAPAPLPTSEFSFLKSDPSFISSAIVLSSSVISSLQSFSSSLLPSTVVSSIEPSSIISSAVFSPCPCDIHAPDRGSVSSSSLFHSVPTEEKDLKDL